MIIRSAGDHLDIFFIKYFRHFFGIATTCAPYFLNSGFLTLAKGAALAADDVLQRPALHSGKTAESNFCASFFYPFGAAVANLQSIIAPSRPAQIFAWWS